MTISINSVIIPAKNYTTIFLENLSATVKFIIEFSLDILIHFNWTSGIIDKIMFCD